MNNNEITKKQGDRIKILSPKERKEIYGLPQFTKEDRIEYFELNYFELEHFNKIRTPEAKVLFVLQLGYFKAKFQFYGFQLSDAMDDIKYIANKYLDNIIPKNLKVNTNHKTGVYQKKAIKKMLEFKTYEESNFNDNYLLDICKIDINPKFLYQNLYSELIRQKIIIPSYTTFQLLIRKAIQDYETQLFTQIGRTISIKDSEKIDKFMVLRDKNISKLAFVRTSSKGFRLKYIKEEVEKREYLEPLIDKAKQIIKELDLSEAVIKKYATYIDAYQYSHIKKWSENRRNLHILCFIYYRYLRSNDDMVRTFMYWTGKYENDIKTTLRDKILKENMENSKKFPLFAKFLKIIYDKEIWKNLSKEEIWDKITSLLDEDEAKRLEEFFEKNYKKQGKFKWTLYDKIYGSIKMYMRTIFLQLNFDFSENLKRNKPEVVEFIMKFQDSIENRKEIDWSKFPYKKQDKEKKYVKDDMKRLEIYLYNLIRYYIYLGEIYVKDSLEFRHIEDDLISKEEFQKNKRKILNEANLPYLSEPLEPILDEKIKYLNNMYKTVNTSILNGENDHFNEKPNDNWSLRYDAQEEEAYEDLFSDFEAELIDVLQYVQSNTNFLSALEHIAPKGVKKEEDSTKLIAVLLAHATNLKLGKIAKNLKEICTQKVLTTIAMTRFREETLLKANEMIINKTAELPIFNHFNIDDMGAIHSSSDGQKFAVSVNTITARYSQKYFGKGKGLSIVTLSANFQPLASKLLSANEYEGHYVLELLLMNESEIQPTRHSTDNHGINDVNFGILDFFGFKFCPRYKTLSKKTNNLVAGFVKEMPEEYKIKPKDKVNKMAILQQEDDIKRVIASIALKKTTAGTIIKKISNLPDKNSLKYAFSEFNRIVASTYILEYINDNELRRQVQIALNRGEFFHKLKKVVFYANNGKIQGKSESEQKVYQDCAMVVCSAIIYYNCRILSKLMRMKKLSKEEFDKIVKTTPFAWNHIDIYGKYDFSKKKKVKELEKKLK